MRTLEIRIHGRGGQGGVTAAQILADAAYRSGKKEVQAFPHFGAERRGAPVEAFVRISDEKIYRRTQIYRPSHVMVLDSFLIQLVEVDKGIVEDGYIVLNTEKEPKEFDFGNVKVATVNATKIARERDLKVGGLYVVNTPMVGGMAKILDLNLDAVEKAIRTKLEGKVADANVEAARETYDLIGGG